MTTPHIGVVLMSMGNRPAELAAALESLRQQKGVNLDVVLLGNGWKPTGVPAWVRTCYEPNNVGIPEGRNIGAEKARGDYLFFFDDDAVLPDSHVLERMVAALEQDSRNAVIGPLAQDPEGKPTPRRWIPRLRTAGGGKPGPATWFLEGVHLSRRSAFLEVGGWPGHFFFSHEGVDLAFRYLEAGWVIQYDPSINVLHPATAAARHAVFLRMNARNRVWVARRNLPSVLIPVYLGNWVIITLLRIRHRADLQVWFRGFREGWKRDPGAINPISWKTVWRMTRLGRPPII